MKRVALVGLLIGLAGCQLGERPAVQLRVGDTGSGVPTAKDIAACNPAQWEIIYDPATDVWTCES